MEEETVSAVPVNATGPAVAGFDPKLKIKKQPKQLRDIIGWEPPKTKKP